MVSNRDARIGERSKASCHLSRSDTAVILL
jgi:hypothetical protein